MKRLFLYAVGFLGLSNLGYAQTLDTIKVAGNLTVKNIPAIPTTIVEEVQPYTEFRAALFQEWHPTELQMMISTRFANTNQFHWLDQPMGMRKQMTFFNEAPSGAIFHPTNSRYFIYSKDKGGNEFANLYLMDRETGKITALTNDARAQNGGVRWNKDGSKIIYTSTRRKSGDRDIYIMNPMDPSSDKLLLKLDGGGWSVADWSEDEQKLLINKMVSVNESSVWMYDVATSKFEQVWPMQKVRSVNRALKFSKDGKQFYMLTDEGHEFVYPVLQTIGSKSRKVLLDKVNASMERFTLNKDHSKAAFTLNEYGNTKLYVMDMNTLKYEAMTDLPIGVISTIAWHSNGKNIAFNYTTSNTSVDVYDWNVETRKLTRWTESELGGMNLTDLPSPQLIKWKSFDGREITGFLYQPPSKFKGKRPVIINIHGGPEGQSQPVFIGRNNYFLNELGISIIYPNVRGSVGFGKTFTDLDNGMNREASVKDIGALLDWIKESPDLDENRIMVTGGSYGGYMTLAVAFHYNDRIRCALDVVGISHFTTFLKNTEDYRRDLRRVEYGDERDPKMAAFFEEIAPLNNAQKIKKPMYIVQGRNDPRVPYTEAIQMVEKIEKNGSVVWYLEANDEGHGFRKKSNQDYQFYSTIEFIKRYLLND